MSVFIFGEKMLTFELNFESSTPLYQQLYDFIRNEIIEGKIKANEKLPSKRTLAKNLGISVLTVETAYSQLCAEGFIYSISKKGYFSSSIDFSVSKVVSDKKSNFTLNCSESEKKVKEEIFNFSDNQTDPESFPFSIWAKILREVLSKNQKDVMKNSPSQGTEILRIALAKHLRDFRGMNVNPNQIVIGAGTEYLYTLLIQLLGFEKIYAVEEPCHKKITKIYNSFGVQNVQIPMDNQGVIIEELDSKNVNVVHISPSHHFPTGIVMPVTRRYELLNWVSQKENRFLIEDDYDSEFRFSGRPLPSLQSIDVTEKVIYMNTFTKTLSSTIRISYMVLPKVLMNQFSEKLNFYSCTVPVIDQYTLANFIEQGFFEKHINRMRKTYSTKRELFIDATKKYDTKKIFSIIEGDSGLHFILEVEKIHLKAFLENVSQKNIKISSISDYYSLPSQEKSNLFIINYSSIPKAKIEDYIKILVAT